MKPRIPQFGLSSHDDDSPAPTELRQRKMELSPPDATVAPIEETVNEAFLKLPPAQRRAYALSQQGLPAAAGAKRLGISEEAATALIRSAGRKLGQPAVRTGCEQGPAAWESALRQTVAAGPPPQVLEAIRKAVMARGGNAVAKALSTTVPALWARMDHLSRLQRRLHGADAGRQGP